MVLNAFSLLLVRSRAARGHVYECWDEADLPQRFAVTRAHRFPTCAGERGLQCCTGMPFTRDAVPSRRAEQESLCYSTVLWCLKALICISQNRNAAALLAAKGFAAAPFILWRAWPGCRDGEWVWTDFQDYYRCSSSYPWCRMGFFSAETP